MSIKVSRGRSPLFYRVSSIALLGSLIAGCSSGFQRFDTSLYDSATPQQTSQISNPYPGDIDSRTTASVAGSRFAPVADVAPAQVPQGVYHKPEPTYVAPQPTYAPKPYAPYVAPQAQNQSQPQRQPLSQANTIRQSTLPAPVAQPIAIKKPAEVNREVARYVAPKPEVQPQKVYIPQPSKDSLKTAAVQAVAPVAPAPVIAAPAPIQAAVTQAKTTKDGWSSAGATSIKAGQGETLYNISKRYGVPVSAIRSVNNMSPSSSLRYGQTVIIPNYVFNKSAAVSAPDNNPQTRAARASTGYLGEAAPSKATYPTKRPDYYAAVSPSGAVDESRKQRYIPKTHVSPPVKERTPDYSVVTGSVAPSTNSTYTVQSGDSLSRIASRNGVSVSALQQANGLTGSNIRVGQKLKLPGGIDPLTTASVKKAEPVKVEKLPPNVDPIVTGAIKPNAVDEAPAPARTGISNFRWPVKGRVVSTFGEAGTNGKNEGIDISVPEGTSVHAAENGVVIYVGDEISSYGKLILIRHDDDWVSAYAHNRNYEVKKGDQVRRGQIIARSGRTGNAERPKVHFELRKNSSPVNPKKYLAS